MKRSFYLTNFKNPSIFLTFGLLFLFPIGFMIFVETAHIDKETLYILFGFFFLLPTIIILIGISIKITIDEERITYKSWFKEFNIKWREVESDGGLIIGRYVYKEVDPDILKPFNWLGNPYFYVSRKANFKPIKNTKISKDYIHFHFRKDIYKWIMVKLERKTSDF